MWGLPPIPGFVTMLSKSTQLYGKNAHVHYNADWSGDVTFSWSDVDGIEHKFEIPGDATLTASRNDKVMDCYDFLVRWRARTKNSAASAVFEDHTAYIPGVLLLLVREIRANQSV